MSNGNGSPEIKLDRANLYREETFTDLRVGSIQRLTPVQADGTPDLARAQLFVGEAQLLSPAGPVPLRTEIAAKTLEEAIDAFPAAMQKAVEQLMEEIRELQRQQSSRIVVPGGPLPGGGLPGDLGGGGGGRIRLK